MPSFERVEAGAGSLMGRRDFLGVFGAAGISSFAALCDRGRSAPRRSFDVLVVGAGVFGTWTARSLHDAGKRVAVIDAFGAAHGGASSGGRSRVTRCGYGAAEVYTEWACRSMADWHALSARASPPLFHDLGVLWLHGDGDEFVEASARVLAGLGVPFARLDAAQLRARYPVLRVGDGEAGFLEPRAGGLMAGRAVRHLAGELEADGVTFLRGEVLPVRAAHGVGGALPAVRTRDGREIAAESFVFACGPWLDRVCPDAMGGRLFVTAQEVLFFDVDRERTGALPVWADLPFYGFPNLEGQGFKVADDTHGPPVGVRSVNRRPTADRATSEARARAFMERRFPSLADSPLKEVRVCQYENSSNGDFVLDGHPGLDNVWLAGCGSGHGFKHGPAVGAHVAGLVLGTATRLPRFSLESKRTRQEREVQ